MNLLFRYRRYLFFGISCFFLILFYFFSLGVKQEQFAKINFDATVRLQDKLPQRLESYWEDLALVVSPGASVVLVLVVTSLGLFDWKKRKVVPWVLIIPIAFGLMIGAEVVGKDRVESPAPPYMFLKNPTTHFPKYHVQEGYSYPSGHAARSLFLSSMIVLVLSKNCKIAEAIKQRRFFSKRLILLVFVVGIVFTLSLGVALGKVYLGHHWVSDIVGGWIIAIAFMHVVMGVYR